MLENFQGDSWGSIPPLRMLSLLPHDLCHGWRSSCWLPALQLPHWVALSTLSIMKPVHLPYSLKWFFFFFLLMKYEIWLESFSCCLLLTGQIFSAMCGWSFTICLLLKTHFLCLPQVLNSNQAYPLDYFLLVIHDDMANGDWKRYPPPKKLEWENQGFWGLRIRMPDIIVSASSLCHRRWPYSVIYMKREHCWVFQVQ